MTAHHRTKAQRKAEARRQRAEKSAAVAAQIWEDRDGKARPTPERRAKGAFVLRDTEDAGATVAVDEEASMIGKLARAGIIAGPQVHAADDLAALLERTRIMSRVRSCLDTTPIGHEGDSEPTHGELRDAQERAEIYLSCGVAIWRELLRLCQDDGPPRNIGLLRQGLDIVARYWRLQ